MTGNGGIRDRLGSRQSLAWATYDWANWAFATTVVAAVFPNYYQSVIGAGRPDTLASVYFGYTTAIGLALIAFTSPVLGAIADHYRAKKPLLGAFVALGVCSTGGLFFTTQGDVLLASVLFVGGAVLLSRVDVEAGRRVAHESNAAASVDDAVPEVGDA